MPQLLPVIVMSCSKAERDLIAARAEAAGLNLSNYQRSLNGLPPLERHKFTPEEVQAGARLSAAKRKEP